MPSFFARKIRLLLVLPTLLAFYIWTIPAVFAVYNPALTGIIEEFENIVLPKLEDKDRQEFAKQLKEMRQMNDVQAKKKIRTLLLGKLFKQIARTDPEVLACLDRASSVIIDIENEPKIKLEKLADEYFRGVFKDNLLNIEFQDKRNGVQFGAIAIVKLKNSPARITYYIKTHRFGLLASTPTSTGPQQLDPKELFVYKVLELIGVVPETHFFYNDIKDFYIATKDAGFDDSSDTQGQFLTYESLKSKPFGYDTLSRLAEVWAGKSTDESFLEQEASEKNLGVNEWTVIKGLAKADIISRIFLLGDLTTNAGNIGFVQLGDNLTGFKIVDFTLPGKERPYTAEGLFTGFLSGNGVHRYANSMVITRYSLYSRHPAKRVQLAREIIVELATQGVSGHVPLALNIATIDKAHTYVRDLLLQCPGFTDTSADTLKDLHDYVSGVIANMDTFERSILYVDERIMAACTSTAGVCLWPNSSAQNILEGYGLQEGIERRLYTDNDIRTILEHFLPEREGFIVTDPTVAIFENIEMLRDVVRIAVRSVLADSVVAMPIHLHGNHWAGAVFRRQRDGNLQVIYNNPQGFGLETEPNAVRFVEIIRAMMPPNTTLNIVDLRLRQQHNGIDCGPFTVDNLVRIARTARNGRLDGARNPANFIELAELNQPEDGTATGIRLDHAPIIRQHNLERTGPVVLSKLSPEVKT